MATTKRTPILRAVGTTLVLCALLLGLPACSGGSSARGTKLTVPVLWAGTDGNGAPAGGVERATVRVAQEGEAGFGLDLSSVEAKAAGPQWLAASTSAAAVATLLSGTDPADVDITYTVTGSIDGPSGGAILTVGTLAAIRGTALDPKVTMTGTISPDGTVGPISGVPLKLRGAAKAGFTTVLLPLQNLRSTEDPQTTDMIELGRSLGLEVRGVKDVSEAYQAFTGSTIVADITPDRRLSDPVALAASTTSQRLINRLRAELAVPGVDGLLGDEVGEIRSETERAQTAIASGDAPSAYGLAQDAYTRLVRQAAAARTRSTTATGTSGQRAAATAVGAQITELLTEADAQITSDAKVTELDQVAQLSMPFAMGWVTYAQAVLTGLGPVVDNGSITSTNLPGVAATVAEQRASIEVFGVDAVEIVRASRNPSVRTTSGVAPTTFLSNYTNFLNRAADANVAYFRVVLNRGAPQTIDPTGAPNYLWLATKAYQDEALRTPADEQAIEQEVAQSARSITYFVLGSTMVAGRQAFGLDGSGIGSDPTSAARTAAVDNAVLIAGQNVDNQVTTLAGRGVDASAALWSSLWGRASATEQASTPRALAGSVVALNELWYDVIWVSALQAAFGS